MVALEALKESMAIGASDVNEISSLVNHQWDMVNTKSWDIKEEMATSSEHYHTMASKVQHFQDKCQYAQVDLQENKETLILYC